MCSVGKVQMIAEIRAEGIGNDNMIFLLAHGAFSIKGH